MSSRAARRTLRPLPAPAAAPGDGEVRGAPTSHPTIHARAVSGDAFRWFAARPRPTSTRTILRRAS